jgi:hypothetical protein
MKLLTKFPLLVVIFFTTFFYSNILLSAQELPIAPKQETQTPKLKCAPWEVIKKALTENEFDVISMGTLDTDTITFTVINPKNVFITFILNTQKSLACVILEGSNYQYINPNSIAKPEEKES